MILTLVAMVFFGVAVGGWLYLDTRYYQQTQRWSRRDANLEIYNERVADGDDQDSDQRKVEAGHLLLTEVSDEVPDTTGHPRSFVFQLTGSILVCVLGFLGYLVWGDLQAPSLEQVSRQFEALPTLEPEQRKRNLENLIVRLERRNNSRRWSVASSDYLIFAYSFNKDLDGVIRTHKLAEQRGASSSLSDLERIEAEILFHGALTPEARRVAEKVLADIPDQPKIMQLFGVEAFREEDYLQARNYFERGVRNTRDPSRARLLEELVIRTNDQLADDHNGIRLTIDLQALSEIGVDLWLTVFAQTEENQPPVAVVQRPFVRKEKYNIVLDDAVSMLPSALLSNTDRVRVVARLSTSQEIVNTNIIQEVSSGWLDPGTLPNVSLSFTDTTSDDGVSISVSVGAGITADDDATVFIIGRAVDSLDSDPPLIVKRVRSGDLPLDVLLTVEDAMLPLDQLPTEGLEVYARLSKTGNTSRAVDDIESNRTHVQVGQSVRLMLDQVVRDVDLLSTDAETDT